MSKCKMNFTWLYNHMLWVAARFDLQAVGTALDGVRKAGVRMKYVESIAHELAHMICLGPTNWSSKQIAEYISTMGTDLADEQECKACAVEVLGLEGLLFPKDMRVFIPAGAVQNMNNLGGPATFQRIYDLMEEPAIIQKSVEFVELVRIAKRPPNQLKLPLEKPDVIQAK